MYKNLSPGAIGIRNYGLVVSLELARKTGFEGIDFNIREAADLAEKHGADHVRQLFEQAGVKPGAWGLPVAWREDRWREDLKQLPELAAVGQAIGALRTQTWCPPSSDHPFEETFNWHVDRFGPIAQALEPYGVRFGIEFIGPQSLRPPEKHAFIYTMEGMLDLCRALGTGNVGLLLDAWHLYTSGGSIDDLDKISNADVVSVHVNDAPDGLIMADYNDHDRRLPMETGVIDLPGFMRKLAAMNYDGPVTPEPFSQRVNSIEDPLEAARLTASYMDKMWSASGLA
ncbi:MAG TPA: sugar phosphate isomerase/epimerase family protein [Spirillospora sp.]|nr:sugar phosphate isomerase/epimerase family protein [Spirillospora sp.]